MLNFQTASPLALHQPSSPAKQDAIHFLQQFAQETGRCPLNRLGEVLQALSTAGTYEMTAAELEFAAKIGWRNNTRCIGRLFWRGLTVRDLRHLRTEDEIFEALVDHLREATNGGKLRPMITVFAPRQPDEPGIRIWNNQLIRYAGYRQTSGTVIGDPANVELTQQLIALGWEAKGGQFDVLPLAIELPGRAPKLYEIPKDAVLEVPLTHPDYDWFADLGLKWHALPAISDMMLDAGGLQYTAVPFSGWYMCTEIGSRNLGDESRYNLLPVVGRKMGLNTRRDRTLWKDRVLLEMNVAVMHSFQQAGVTIMDHHTAARDFMRFAEREEDAGRIPFADWAWIVPPMSGSACPVYHREFVNETVKPNFLYQPKAWLK